MGQTSKKLRRKFRMTGSVPGRSIHGRQIRLDIPSIEDFIKQGLDPVHAAYAFVQHIVSHFAEGASQLPELKKFADLVPPLPWTI